MTGILSSLLRLRAIAGLLLALVALQATPAQPLPLVRDAGSAFSASSAEVALPGRLSSISEVRALPRLDPLPPPPQALRLVQRGAFLGTPRRFAEPPLAVTLALAIRPASPARAPPAT